MTPIWWTAPLGLAHSRNTEGLSVWPLGGRAVRTIDYNYTTDPQLLHTLYTHNKHFQPPLICYIHISWYVNVGLTRVLMRFCMKQKLGMSVSCVVFKRITSTTNSKLMTTIMELIVLSACPKCGETEGWLSWGLWPITSLSALHFNNKQRSSGHSAP